MIQSQGYGSVNLGVTEFLHMPQCLFSSRYLQMSCYISMRYMFVFGVWFDTDVFSIHISM